MTQIVDERTVVGEPAAHEGRTAGRERVTSIMSELEVSLRQIRCARAEQLHRSGVSMTHLFVIWRLEEHADGLPMGRLADLLGVSMSNATGLIDRMEERGLVERVRPPDDRRVVHVHPTAAGIQAARAFELIRQDTLESVLARLDDEQVERLARSLEDLRVAIAEAAT